MSRHGRTKAFPTAVLTMPSATLIFFLSNRNRVWRVAIDNKGAFTALTPSDVGALRRAQDTPGVLAYIGELKESTDRITTIISICERLHDESMDWKGLALLTEGGGRSGGGRHDRRDAQEERGQRVGSSGPTSEG